MELEVMGQASGNNQKLSLSDQVFGIEFKEGLIHQVVTAYLAGGRAGTKAQKNRSDVSGGGKKPWRQKGTGRARAGSIRSPLWRSGGVTFAARPRSFKQKINRKMYQLAMTSILSELVRQSRLLIVDEFTIAQPKTRDMALKLKELGFEKGLIVLAEENQHVQLAARNIANINLILADMLNPVALVGAEKILMSQAALKKIEEKFA